MPRIAKLETLIVPALGTTTWVFVEVHTTDGLVGVGEASLTRLDEGVVAQVKELEPLYVGKDPAEIRELHTLLLRNPWHRGRVRHSAVSAIDQALWDLTGLSLGVPTAVLLGGPLRSRIRLYANLEPATPHKSLESYADNATKAVEQGFSAVKLNAFDPLPEMAKPAESLDFPQLRRQAYARLQTVRAAIGPDVELLVDFQARVPQSEAAQAANELAEFRPYWLQEPLSPGDPQRLTQLRAQVTTRIADGDQECGIEPFRNLIQARAIDVVRPDVKWAGGITVGKKIATIAEAFDLEVSPHNLSGPIATAASAQLASTLSNFTILEYPWNVAPWRHELVKGGERVEAGHLLLDPKPGNGLEWDPVAARRLAAKRALA